MIFLYVISIARLDIKCHSLLWYEAFQCLDKPGLCFAGVKLVELETSFRGVNLARSLLTFKAHA